MMLSRRMNAGFRVILAVLLAGPATLRAQDGGKKAPDLRQLRIQDQERLAAAPSAGFRSGVGKPLPNAELPDHVPAPVGEFTVFADFGNPDPNGVPLFLVNRTANPVELPTQDNDPYFKLEYRDDQGHWKRAEVHINSWCGNSYFPVTLHPGQHFRFLGYRPQGGQTATVRYRNREGLVSNVGKGFFVVEDVAVAEVDDLEASGIPRGLTEILRVSPPFSTDGRVPPKKYAAALKLLSTYRDSGYYRREAKRYLEWEKPDPADAGPIVSILEKRWPAESEPLSLFKFVLSGADELKDFPELKWKVVKDLLQGDGAGRTDPAWRGPVRQTYAMMPDALKSSNPAEVAAAADVLAVPWATDELVATADLRRWLEHGDPAVVTVSANALSRRADWDWMAAKGMGQSPNTKMAILSALANGGLPESQNLRNPNSPEESAFWKHCATEHPVMTVQALYYVGSGIYHGNGFHIALHEPLRDFLAKEADLMEANPAAVANEEHGYPVAQVVTFVGAWKRKTDEPLFRRLLKHPGYQGGIGTDDQNRRFDFRRLRMREDAKSVLQSMGGFVGDDVILKEKIPLPPE